MRFTPKSDSELAAELLLPPGIYPVRVSFSEDTTSKKSGEEMIAVKLTVYATDGSERTVRDWLLPSQGYKLKSACKAFGLSALYDSGAVSAHDLLGAEGFAKIKIEEDKTGKYDPANRVQSYLAERPEEAAQPAPKPAARLVARPSRRPRRPRSPCATTAPCARSSIS